MNKQNNPQSTDKTPTRVRTGTGAIRRIFNVIRRWEEMMDYSQYDYTLNRIRYLEGRVLELESQRNATVEMPTPKSL
ncbi:hypothetical protein [Methyloradius palustris]|uniref:Uncharacterized protein n=1 Tax=Methyloradius palustris TaxID=2778876 RepID=A0A8D5FYN5_9PROT|nr:hypothetical protein [Methyloradius palustris]BCM24482.1 hypothetical protein ZMTM_07410 [Methyloradius palustris]